MIGLLTYVGVGAGLAIMGLCVPSFGRVIDRMATRAGMDVGYGRVVWFGGTMMAWPIGLFVLATGRLLLVHTEPSATTEYACGKAKTDKPQSTETGRWITGDRTGP